MRKRGSEDADRWKDVVWQRVREEEEEEEEEDGNVNI